MGDHPRIAKYYGRLEDGGLLLEFATGGGLNSFRKIFPQASQPLLRLWCLQLTEGIVHTHSHNILITNIHAGNAVVDLATLGVKLVDFGGAVIDRSPVCIWETSTHHLPRPDFTASVKSDLFALGHTLLTILLGHHPRDPTNGAGHYSPEEEEWVEAFHTETEQQYRAGIFPDVSQLQPSALGEVLRGCWEQRFESAQEVLDALKGALDDVDVFKTGDDRRAALGTRVELTNWEEFVETVSDDEIYSGVISTEVERYSMV
ncbi:kinase-like domain-containing protein [Leucosporidium creatinivorum]|uniref:Kinase-like domain-containing protein n=1 Tax=Leucosporidium creatinivorum TaxID=106004 RepID=A0A1Y2ER94_9BASI|nr:kinase-like domain-containing protein [Leucosporidium creatinivorum]